MPDENVSTVGQPGDTTTGTAPTGQTASEPQAGAPAAGATAQPPVTEDRKDWVPPYRLREVTERSRQIEEAYRQAAVEAQMLKRQVAALTGVAQPTQDDPEIVAARQFLVQQFPALEKLSLEKVERILQMADKLPDVAAITESYWDREGYSTMREVFKKAQDVFGGELNEDQKNMVHALFVRFVDGDPQNRQRYEVYRDPALVDDFFKKFSGAVVDPLRRKVTTSITQTAERGRRLPRGGSGGAGVVVGQGKKTPKDAKEAAQMMHEIMQAG